MHARTIILILLLLSLLGRQAFAADELSDRVTTITIKSTVRLLADHGSITLGDIAYIQGPQATAIEALILSTPKPIASGQWTTISHDTIRSAIDSASGLQVGSIMLVGSDSSLTRRRAINKTTMPSNNKPITNSEAPEPILRDVLERWVYARPWLKSTPGMTRITFGTGTRDQNLLNTLASDRQIIITELGRSKRVSCQIAIYENEVLITETSIRFDVAVQRAVRVANAVISRNELVSDQSTSIETRWISPMDSPADPKSSLGLACKNSVNPGVILLSSMIEQPVIIERGAIVSARSLSGTVSVTMSVRSLSDGRLGDIIELESRDRSQRFNAKVAGPNRVIIIKKPVQLTSAGASTTSQP